MLSFLSPWALWSALVLPVFFAIYWLRHRQKKQHLVSSLMLWQATKVSRDGGIRLQRLQLPWWFFLELFILICLILAAARPALESRTLSSVIVIMDDSYSMHAGGQKSAKFHAQRAFQRWMKRSSYKSAWLIVARESPRLLGKFGAKDLAKAWERWRADAVTSNLHRAVAFAYRLAGKDAKLIVLTDRRPSKGIQLKRLRWWSFGRPLGNVAWVQAVRSRAGKKDRVLLEVSNLSRESRKVTVKLRAGKEAERHQILHMRPKETRRLVFTISPQIFVATLEGDELSFDNQVTLLPAPREMLRVDVALRHPRWKQPVHRALQSSKRVLFSAKDPDLIVTDGGKETDATPRGWTLYLRHSPNPVVYTGPFVAHQTHPLMEGLSLQGVLWSSGKTTESPGTPLLMADKTALLRVTEDPEMRHQIYLHANPLSSTLTQSVNWPILLWNLIEWRRIFLPGIRQPNVRLGSSVRYRMYKKGTKVSTISPKGKKMKIYGPSSSLQIPSREPGLHRISEGRHQASWVANVLHKEESTLLSCSSGRWGGWTSKKLQDRVQASLVWSMLLFLLACLIVHHYFYIRRLQM